MVLPVLNTGSKTDYVQCETGYVARKPKVLMA